MKCYIQKIKHLLEVKKITQDELSQKIGKNKNTITNYLTETTKIDIDTLQKIADVLEVPITFLFEGDSQNELSIILSKIDDINIFFKEVDILLTISFSAEIELVSNDLVACYYSLKINKFKTINEMIDYLIKNIDTIRKYVNDYTDLQYYIYTKLNEFTYCYTEIEKIENEHTENIDKTKLTKKEFDKKIKEIQKKFDNAVEPVAEAIYNRLINEINNFDVLLNFTELFDKNDHFQKIKRKKQTHIIT
jgi:transcriptional regulator with XRE-family HTH domain